VPTTTAPSVLRPSAGALRARLPELSPASNRIALRVLMLSLGRLVEIEGAERIMEAPEPTIFALNHNNAFEAVIVPATLIRLRGGRRVHFLADWMYLHLPAVGWLLRESGAIPVYRKPARWRLGEAHRQERRREPVLDICLARLAAGSSLGIFPEGTRNPDPARLLKPRGGLGEIVLGSEAPVVPVGIRYPAAARLGRAPRLGRLVLRPGEPLAFAAERREARGAAGRERREIARRVVSRVMAELQELSGKKFEIHPPERRAA
jgi:1-acyl-sn-glycerol-3-phosphate acyltransferase